MHTNEILTTFTAAAALGVCLFTLANHLRTSAIVVLLLGGILAGPEVLHIVHPKALGDGLGTIISLAVAIILFEGGLTLDLRGYQTVSKEIWRILTIGVLATWLGSATLLHFVFGFAWDFCFLAASLIIVTGPTVIGPLLHRIRVQKNLHHILHWEGVLIDPIGVFIALLCFEYYVSTDGAHQLVVTDFILRFVAGAAIGVAAGYLLDNVLKRGWINKGHTNIFALVMAMLTFALSDLVIAESGLLAVTVAGLILGYRKTPQLHQIVSYKVELKDFLIGLLFVLLAANLELRSFLAYGWKLAAVVAVIMLVIRPLNIFLSMQRSSLSVKEKAFLSWIAPRGIVAASMASVFALKLSQAGTEHAAFLETFTYSVIAGTVIIQGFSAGAVGRMLGVVRPVPTGWIIVGAHPLARTIARFIKQRGFDVTLVDTNAREVREAEREGLVALSDDAMRINPEDHPACYGCGKFLALTPNQYLNRTLCHRWAELLEGAQLYYWERAGHETNEESGPPAGERIWAELPLNHWMAPDSEAPPLREQQRADSSLPAIDNILFAMTDTGLKPGIPRALSKEDTGWLVYDPEEGIHHRALPLDPDNVIFSEQTELPLVYRELIDHLERKKPEISADSLLEEMQQREKEFTSLLGHGIAMPHTRVNTVDEAVLLVSKPTTPIACPVTGREIDIVFMLISPSEQPQEHLKYISHIARLIGVESQRQALLQAPDATALYELIARS